MSTPSQTVCANSLKFHEQIAIMVYELNIAEIFKNQSTERVKSGVMIFGTFIFLLQATSDIELVFGNIGN